MKTPRFAVVAIALLFAGLLFTPASAVQFNWSQVFTIGATPPARDYGAAVIGDGAGNLFMFGGSTNGGTRFGDVWRLTNAAAQPGPSFWSQTAPSGGPQGRYNSSIAYDNVNDRLMVFGGCLGGCFPITNEVWVLVDASGQNGFPGWLQLSPSGTPPQARHAAITGYDPGTNKLIVFGGQDGSGVFNLFTDVKVLTNANGMGGSPVWQTIPTSGTVPPGRYGLSGAYDPATDRLIVTGGYNPSGQPTNAVYVLDHVLSGPATWSNLIAEGAAGSPPPFAFVRGSYDEVNGRLFVTTPNAGTGTHDVWVLTNAASWKQIAAGSGPATPGTTVMGTAYNRFASVLAGVFAGPVSVNTTWAIALNNPPQFVSPTPADGEVFTLRQGQTFTATLTAEDPDPDASVGIDITSLPPTAISQPGPFSNPHTRTITWNTINGDGPFVVTYKAFDNLQAQTTRSFTINVTPNHAPQFAPSSPPFTIPVIAGMPVSYTVAATDPDPGDTAFLTTDFSALPPGALLTGGGSSPFTFTWTPGLSQVGTFGMQYKATDDAGFSLFYPVTIIVAPNNPPHFLNLPAAFNTQVGVPLNLTVQAVDSDPGHLATIDVDFATLPSGALTTGFSNQNFATRTITWTPGASAVGHHLIHFTASDQYGAAESSDLDVNVEPVTLTSISVSPSSASKHVGQGQSFTATGHFSDGSSAMLPSGPGTNTGGSPLWQTFFSPMINVAPCATAQYPLSNGGDLWSSQVFADQGGHVHDVWSPGTPVLTLDGTIDSSSLTVYLSCTNGNTSGVISATWTGTRYEGTYSLGASSGQVSIRGWSTKAPMPTGRFAAGAATANNIVYAIGGASGNNLLGTNESYSPQSNSWSSQAPMPTPREGLGVAEVGGLIYAAGGHTAGSIPSSILEAYDPNSNTWTSNLAPMPTPRAHVMAASAGGKLYVIGGDTNPDNSGQTNVVERYDPATNTWTTLAPMPTARSFGAAGAMNNGGTIVVVGGSTLNNNANTSVTELYDVATNTWTTGVPMPQPRAGFSGGVTNGGFFVFGGTTNGSPNADTLIYYPAGQNQQEGWAGLGSMPAVRWELAAAVVGDVVYGIGGQDTNQFPIPGLNILTALSTPLPGELNVGFSGNSSLPTVQWSTTDPNVAMIDASGFASTFNAGQATIIATAANVSCFSSGGNCATLTVTNQSPTVQINGGPFTITEGQNQFLNASASDPDGDSLTYFWQVISGPGSFSNPINFSQSFTGVDGPSDTTIRLTVTDNKGGSASAQTTIHVNNKIPAVSIFGGPNSITEGNTFSTGGNFSDVIADTFTATVNYGDGTGDQSLSFTGTNQTKNFSLSHQFTHYGSFTITVTVTDDDGGVGTATKQLQVNNFNPFVFMSPTNVSLVTGQSYSGNGGFTDQGVNTWSATVDFGDGGGTQPLTLNGKNFSLSHQYSQAGEFNIVVRVSDGLATGQAQAHVSVSALPPFSLAANVPAGECICTPVAHVNAGPPQTWYVKSDASGQLTATLVAVADFQGTAQTLQSQVSELNGNVLAQTQLSLAAGLPDNTQERSAMVVSTAPNTVYRVQVASASTGSPARYFLRFDGAQEAGASTPTPAIEGGFSTWLFNVGAGDGLGVMISTQGLFQPPAGSTTMHYQWIAPDGTELPVQALVVTLPGSPNPVNQVIPPPAAVTPGVWRLRSDFDYDHVIGKFTGADQGAYVDHRSGGRGAIKINLVDGHGNPFLGNVSFTASFGSFAFGSFDTNTGEFFVDAAEAFTYHLDVTAPAGYTVSIPSFDVLVTCDKTTEITVVIADTTAPVMSNVPGNITAQAPNQSGAVVTFNTPAADDNIDGPLTVTCAPPSGSTFPIGTTTVACSASDAAGNGVSGSFTVTVLAPVTNTPPTITVQLSPGSIWPPNHKMVNVSATIAASSPSGHATAVTLVSVTSNEPDNGLGDGDTANDIQAVSIGTDDRAFQVRAERSGGGSGRVYTATYRATDTVTGATTTASATVVVALNQGK